MGAMFCAATGAATLCWSLNQMASRPLNDWQSLKRTK